MKNNIRTMAISVAAVVALTGTATSPVWASNTNDGVCEGLDSGKIDTTGDPQTVTMTAPEGSLITRYCIKAGSNKQGDGPVYVDVVPPQESITVGHPSGKDVSHYSFEWTTPTEPPTEPPTTPPTEEPTPEPPTEEPTPEPPTEPPTEDPTTPPTEDPTEPPTETPTVPPSETPTTPTETPSTPSETPTVPVPTDSSTSEPPTPTETPSETPTTPPTEDETPTPEKDPEPKPTPDKTKPGPKFGSSIQCINGVWVAKFYTNGNLVRTSKSGSCAMTPENRTPKTFTETGL